MFKKLFDFSCERSFLAAVGFYIAYFMMIVLGSFIICAILERGLRAFGVSLSYGAAFSLGNLLAIILNIILAFVILQQKHAVKHLGYLFIALVSAITSYFGGAVIGLIPVSYLSTIPVYKKSEEESERIYSNIQPIWQFVLLMLFTLGLYQLVWFYKNWSEIIKYKGLNWWALWKVLALFVPVYNFFVIYDLLSSIKQRAEEGGATKTYSPGWVLFFYIFLSICSQFILLPLALIPLVFVQKTLNAFWEKEQPDLPVKKTLSIAEFLTIFCVILVMASWLGLFSFSNISLGSGENIEKRAAVSMQNIHLPTAQYEVIKYTTWKDLGHNKVQLSPQIISYAFNRSIVTIQTFDEANRPLGIGSGFVINPLGFILTNKHVLRDAYSAKVYLSDGKVFNNVHLVNIEFGGEVDVACVKINATGLRPVIIGDSSEILPGEDVIVIGAPQGLQGTVSRGNVSAIRNNLIQITAPISPGSSGGPVINSYGEVIGIVKSLLGGENAQNINFAIPINTIK